MPDPDPGLPEPDLYVRHLLALCLRELPAHEFAAFLAECGHATIPKLQERTAERIEAFVRAELECGDGPHLLRDVSDAASGLDVRYVLNPTKLRYDHRKLLLTSGADRVATARETDPTVSITGLLFGITLFDDECRTMNPSELQQIMPDTPARGRQFMVYELDALLSTQEFVPLLVRVPEHAEHDPAQVMRLMVARALRELGMTALPVIICRQVLRNRFVLNEFGPPEADVATVVPPALRGHVMLAIPRHQERGQRLDVQMLEARGEPGYARIQVSGRSQLGFYYREPDDRVWMVSPCVSAGRLASRRARTRADEVMSVIRQGIPATHATALGGFLLKPPREHAAVGLERFISLLNMTRVRLAPNMQEAS
jgi:hypothetical protein